MDEDTKEKTLHPEFKDQERIPDEKIDANTPKPENSTDVFKKPLIQVGSRNKKGTQIRTLDPSSKKKEQSKDDNNLSEGSASDVISVEPESIVGAEVKDTSHQTHLKGKQTTGRTTSGVKNDGSKYEVYKPPDWSGIPPCQYSFEVLKEGVNLEPIELSKEAFYVFGRHTSCDTQLIHPTISRFHLVMQYCSQETEERSKGFYVYDLGSTHGTFLNKSRLKPQIYVRMQVGHQLRLGCSSRIFILSGPEDDMEPESDKTVTELKAEREKKLLEREMAEREKERQEEERKRRQEEEGIDWGMGEDADEETDLSENPFASTNNEELYIDDPKKSLRGWFEREGYDLEYDVEEKGPGQFLCRVEIPMDSSGGKTVAEALVKGKKKEAVVQCALEACRILDRYGLLRQANHESRKRKAKNWEADDFYDSDEDTFLDRTGVVEQKRQQRMAAAGRSEQKAETYESLMKNHEEMRAQIAEVERKLERASEGLSRMDSVQEEDEEDALDSFMKTLKKSGAADKSALSRLKMELTALHKEESKLRRLVNIAKPANLPPLQSPSSSLKHGVQPGSKVAPIIGSLKRVNAQKRKIIPPTVTETKKVRDNDDENTEEVEEDEVEEDNHEKETKEKLSIVAASVKQPSSKSTSVQPAQKESESAGETKPKGIIGPAKPSFPLRTVKDEDSLDAIDKVDDDDDDEEEGEEEQKESKKRKRNRVRQHKKSKNFSDSQENYSADTKYSTWVPPEGQTGDGRTSLNDKLGY